MAVKPVLRGLFVVIWISAAAAISAFADSITIPMLGTASFYDVAYSNVNKLGVNYTGNTVYPDYSAVVTSNSGYDDRYHSTSQSASITAFTPNAIDWSSAIIKIIEWSDGNPVLSLSFGNLGLGSCVSQDLSAPDASLNACSSQEGSTLTYNRSAGQSDYYEYAFSQYRHNEYWNNGFVFSYSNNYAYGPHQGTYDQHGVAMPVGLQYRVDLEVQDGSATYRASPRMTLEPSGWTNGYLWNCHDLPDSNFDDVSSGTHCSEALAAISQRFERNLPETAQKGRRIVIRPSGIS